MKHPRVVTSVVPATYDVPMRSRYGTIDTNFATQLATFPVDQDGPALMVNFMRYHAEAQYADGTTGVSGKEADDRYAPVEILADIGAHVAFFGDVVESSASDRWDRVGIVQYPTRRAFIEMQSRRDFQAKHEHKAAGMEFTIVVVAVPVASGGDVLAGSAPVRFVLWPLGSSVEVDGDVAVFHVEGRVIGDERAFGTLTIHPLESPLPTLPDGSLWAVSSRSIDRLGALVEAWPDSKRG